MRSVLSSSIRRSTGLSAGAIRAFGNVRSSAFVRYASTQNNAETPTKKLRGLKDVPAELYPLFITVALGLTAAGIAIFRKFVYDPAVKVNRLGNNKD
ncbi:hypothetical protein V1514DRAFT_334337 [Lipomyces japonicus]|uniref:uncharacterized protein n=1 Tax=Lipomyces japonicus TaxID=56871 RepID=UPI0034CD2B62